VTRVDGVVALLEDEGTTAAEKRAALRLWRDLVAGAKPAGAETLPLSPRELQQVRRVLQALDRALARAARRNPRHLELMPGEGAR
jgi:hypothetical protein